MWDRAFATDPADDDEHDAEYRQLSIRYALFCGRLEGKSGKPVTPDALAFSMDASGYRADFLVSADFGCVMHEPKP